MKYKKKFNASMFVGNLLVICSLANASTLFASDYKLEKKGAGIAGTPTTYKYTLNNGLKVIIVPDFRNPVATVRTIFDAGSKYETIGQTGMAHFFEHMMFRKTAQTPEGFFSNYLAAIGGNGNAGTSTDFVEYYSEFPSPALNNILQLDFQRFASLTLTDPYFTTEKGAVISERGISVDNAPAARGQEYLRKIVEQGTGYAWPTIGSKEDVVNMRHEDVSNFYKNLYTPDNAVMLVGGPIKAEEAIADVNKIFGKWQGKAKKTPPVFPADYLTRFNGQRFICSEQVAAQQIKIVYPSFDNTYDNALMADLFTKILDANPEGTLERRLLKANLGIQIKSYKDTWTRESQPFVVNLVLNPEHKLNDALSFWQQEIEQVMKKNIDNAMRTRLIKAFEVSNAERALKMTSLVEDYMYYEFFYHDFLIASKDIPFVKALTAQKLKHWIKQNLSSKNYYITGITPPNMAPKCSELAINIREKK